MAPSAASEELPTPTRREIEEAVTQLIEANRARCLWFAPVDYLPATDEERLHALQHIERHGNRQAFVRARELRDWVLLATSGQ